MKITSPSPGFYPKGTGLIGEILNAKPEDRRFLIAEVAGVMKYKVRKAEALSKLESSRLNLQRINDIVAEVKRQINSLDRQVKKAERYKRLSAEAQSIELKLAKRDYTALKESLELIAAEHTLLKDREVSVRAEITTRENTRETRRLALLEREKALEVLLTELQGTEREIAEVERSIAIVSTDRSNLTEFARKLAGQEAEISQRIADNEDRRREIESSRASTATPPRRR